MSPAAYRTSVRRLVVYTATLCIVIGYAFFVPDLTPAASVPYYEQSPPVQAIYDEEERTRNGSVAGATLPEDDVIEASAAFRKIRTIRTGRGKERSNVHVVLTGEDGDLKKSFGKRKRSDDSTGKVFLLRRSSNDAGRLTPALKTTSSPAARTSLLPESTSDRKARGDVVYRNGKPNRAQSTNEVLGAGRNSSSEVLTDEHNASNEHSQFLGGDYRFSVAAQSADKLVFKWGGDVTTSNRSRTGRVVRDAAVSHVERPERRLPQAIIIGVKKGGTRAVLEYLRLHPQVRAAGPEPHFFDKNYHRGFGWYRSQMPESVRGQLTMEKTPSYLVRERVPARVRAMSPSVKLVLVLRDPVTRAVSDYTQAAAKGRARRSFLHSVTDNRTGTVDRSKPLVRVGLYDEHVSRWLEHFPRSSFHFVSGERLVAQPERELASLQRFLGLRPPWVGARQLVFNSTKGFPCLLREPGATPHCLDPSKGRPHPKVDPVLERRLRDFYAPHNQRLYRIIGRDLGWPP